MPRRREGPLKFWSAAASIGAEAYTLAMTAAEAMGPRGFEVLGTDISESVLQLARMAIYPGAMIDPIPEKMRRSYLLLPRDPTRQEFRIVPELRRLVRFETQNLMDETYARPSDFDVVLCRNVLIYFERAVQDEVIARLTRHVRLGGYLMLGHSESLHRAETLGLKPVAPSVFRRVE